MDTQNAFLITLVVLLPLIPAFILYKFLPSKGRIEGPFQGLTIKLGGAFAGYFVLFVALWKFTESLPVYDVWTVTGQLAFGDTARRFDDRVVRFTLEPAGSRLHPNGSFRLTLIRLPDPSGERALPTVYVDYPRYEPRVLDLDAMGTRNDGRRRIVLTDTIRLRPNPAVIVHDDH